MAIWMYLLVIGLLLHASTAKVLPPEVLSQEIQLEESQTFSLDQTQTTDTNTQSTEADDPQTTSVEPVSTALADGSTTAQPDTTEAPSGTSPENDEEMTSPKYDVTTDDDSTQAENTDPMHPTTVLPTNSTACPDGFFGPWCDYVCLCKNPHDECNKVTGICESGCPEGYYGPGCLLDEFADHLSIVTALSFMLAVCVFVLALLGFYTCVKQPATLKKRHQHSMRAEEAAYDFRDMASRIDSFGVPVVELKRSIPRVSEIDIQVMTDILADGRFGEIYRGKLKVKGKQIDVAYKTIKPGLSEDEKQAFVAQLELYSSIEEHPNVLKFYGVCTVGDQVYAAFEYTEHGNLRNFLRRNSMPESQSDLADAEAEAFSSRGRLLQFAYDVALGMRHLARMRIIHREISGSHILVGHDYVAKISGLNVLGSGSKTKPARWMAPESLLKAEFTVQSDIWSYGVLLWEIMTLGGKPYSDFAVKDIPGALEDGVRLPKPEECDELLYGLMQWCWSENPEDRPTILKVSNSVKDLLENANLRDNLDSDTEDSV